MTSASVSTPSFAAVPPDLTPALLPSSLQIHFDHLNAPNNSQSSNPSTESTSAAPGTASAASAMRRSITLANGRTVEFTTDQVPAPPAVTFVSPPDILRLNGMWDDTTPHWSGESALVISGIPIPIIYWKKVYSSRAKGAGFSWKPRQWKALKTHVSNWRVSLKLLVATLVLTKSMLV